MFQGFYSCGVSCTFIRLIGNICNNQYPVISLKVICHYFQMVFGRKKRKSCFPWSSKCLKWRTIPIICNDISGMTSQRIGPITPRKKNKRLGGGNPKIWPRQGPTGQQARRPQATPPLPPTLPRLNPASKGRHPRQPQQTRTWPLGVAGAAV